MAISRSSTYFLRRIGLIPFIRPGAQVSVASLILQRRPLDDKRIPDWLLVRHEGNESGEYPGTLPWSDPVIGLLPPPPPGG